jgi:hypothetical protein
MAVHLLPWLPKLYPLTMLRLLVVLPCAVIPVLFIRARTKWLTSQQGRRWLIFASVISLLLIVTLLATGRQELLVWTTSLFVVPLQWASVVVLQGVFTKLTGYAPRDVFLVPRGEVAHSGPDRIYTVIGNFVLLGQAFGLLYAFMRIGS